MGNNCCYSTKSRYFLIFFGSRAVTTKLSPYHLNSLCDKATFATQPGGELSTLWQGTALRLLNKEVESG